LSADIFNTIFDEPHFHQENNIARELNRVIETFFTGATRRETLGRIKHYYDTINATAAGIADHHEKQHFLKVVYENFYKAYNPKAADRLGIVYTPHEIVQFMIRSTDYLLHRHFGKTLDSKNVDILDPATGTGTFICDIIDYLPKHKLEYKYKNELHANEVAILPYYIANLNIEYVYKQKMGQYAEFENLCFVDTLDNTGFHWVGKQGDLFGVSAENAARIRKQNERRISVIIGNPPYNARQENYNFQNANRGYKEVDKRIKESFIKYGTAQNQIVVYDMYTRFYRWAMDRLNDNGIIAFITNRSFIDSRAFDGFRKSIQQDFDHAYIIDTKSDVRTNPKIAGTTHNVFGIQTGVAIMLLVKTTSGQLKPNSCRIDYISLPDEWRKEEKLQWFTEHPIEKIQFLSINPDKGNNWINQAENNWDELIPLADKDVKAGNSEKAIFKLFTRGVATQRDEWVYDFSKEIVSKKMEFFTEVYEETRRDHNNVEKFKIKWDRELSNYLERDIAKKFDERNIEQSLYRPYIMKYLYYDRHFNGMVYQWPYIYNSRKKNLYIAFSGIGSSKTFQTVVSDSIISLDCLEKTQCLPFYNFHGDKSVTNITDWALQQFYVHYLGISTDLEEENSNLFKKQWRDLNAAYVESYEPDSDLTSGMPGTIKKIDIFHYVYAVLHHPVYRMKYELNLKREFPRIPLYDNFPQWAQWGKQLMDLHIGYENAPAYALTLKEVAAKETPKAKLKAIKESGVIQLDENTELHGIPVQAWEYKLGNRSALEWVLDQYKEKKPSDPTIAEKFNTYKFSDYKVQVIDLLKKVCSVSVATMDIIKQMPSDNEQ
jgi:predicted helicase